MAGAATQTEAVPRTSRAWFLALCFVMMTSNFIDRAILSILAEPIKAEFALSDLQIGLLGGFAFALFYVAMGIPIARLAETHNRVTIVSVSIAAWSGMTALCGSAASYLQLLLFRVGVAAGEAGAQPPSLSLISDYFPPDRRGFAVAIHSLGMPVGSFAGAIIGGLVAQHWGWRAAFLVVGAPGLLLALLFKLTVAEPARGRLDPAALAASVAAPRPSLGETLARLFRQRSFVHILAGQTIANFAIQAIALFQAVYFIRRFELGLLHAGLVVGIVGGVFTAIGTVLGGALSDRLGRRDRRWHCWVPAISAALTAPLLPFALLSDDWRMAAALMAPPSVTALMFLAPCIANVQNLAAPRMRATAAAACNLVIAIIGLGLGPVVAGWLSDTFAARAFTPGDFTLACADIRASPACLRASGIGVQQAMLAVCGLFVWAAVHFALAARTFRADSEAVAAGA